MEFKLGSDNRGALIAMLGLISFLGSGDLFFISINSELFLNILWERVVNGTLVIACDMPFSFDSPNYSQNIFLAFSQKLADFSDAHFLRKFAFLTKKGRLKQTPFGGV